MLVSSQGILETMEGKGGLRAWQWLFTIEGCLTIVVGLLAVVVLPDFPKNSRGFSAQEKHLAETRMTEDTGMKDETKVSTWSALKMAMSDYKRELFLLLFFGFRLSDSLYMSEQCGSWP